MAARTIADQQEQKNFSNQIKFSLSSKQDCVFLSVLIAFRIAQLKLKPNAAKKNC